MYLNKLLLCVIALYNGLAWALPAHSPRPGGVAVIAIDDAPGPFYYNRHQVMVSQENQQRYAVVGIPLDHVAERLKLTDKNENVKFSVKLEGADYPESHIEIKDKKYTAPSSVDIERRQKDGKKLYGALVEWYDSVFQPSFIKPVAGIVSSEFGLKRFINNKPRSPHKGIDIVATVGTPVVSVQAGKVILADDLYYTGNTVVIDHGQGLKTIYAHLDTMQVGIQNTVEQGQTIGTVGRTGRVTGAHLHFGVSLNNARVDPSLFWIDKMP